MHCPTHTHKHARDYPYDHTTQDKFNKLPQQKNVSDESNNKTRTIDIFGNFLVEEVGAAYYKSVN